MYKKLFSHSIIYGLAPYIPYLSSIIILPLTTPHLTALDFGVYGIIMSYLGFLNVLRILSLHVNFTNSFYYTPLHYKWLWRQIYGFLYLWHFIFSAIVAIIIYFILPKQAQSNYLTITLLTVLPYIILGPISTMARSFYQLNKKPIPIITRNISLSLLTGLLNLLFIAHMKMGYMGWFWSLSIINMLTGLSWIYPIIIKEKITPIFNYKIKTIKKCLSISLPLVPHANALMLLNQSDRVVLDFLNISTKNIGVYTAAYNLGSTLDSVGHGFNQAITPFLYELLKSKNEKKMRNLIFISQIIFFIIALYFSLIAKEFMEFLIRNKELNQAYPLMVIIAMTMIFKPMYIASTIRYFFHEKTKLFALYSLFAGVFNIILNMILIPIYGIEMAAISTFIGFMLLSYSRFWSKTYNKLAPLKYYYNFWMLASILTCILGYYLCQLSFEVRLLAIGLLTALCIPILVYSLKKFKS